MTVVCEVTFQMLLRRGEQKEGDMGRMGGLINPRPWHRQYRSSFSNIGGSPKPQKRAPGQKIHPFIFFVLLGGAAPNGRWGRKGGTPALRWHGIVRATGLDPFRHCSRPNTHLHYMPQCEVTPAGFANCLT